MLSGRGWRARLADRRNLATEIDRLVEVGATLQKGAPDS